MRTDITSQETMLENKIYCIRGTRVMLDRDLAFLYGVTTKRLNEQVKRNSKRFPEDFMFQLNVQEDANLRSQIATSSYGGRRYLTYAFTEHGILMLSSVLNSERAIEVNIRIMRTFVKMRELTAAHKELQEKINTMEKKYDYQFKVVFDAIRKLFQPPENQKREIGFHVK